MDLIASVKNNKGIRFAELLLRQEAILERSVGWSALEFEGSKVVEVGCGPLAGFGPMAIFRGARSFESAEPVWDMELFRSEDIVHRYLFTLHADLCALYGQRMNFREFCEALGEKITVHATGFELAPISGTADIVLSQSCLEHVFALKETVSRLSELQGPQTRFIHLVDFGYHYITPSPFDGLYEEPPEAYIARRGNAINMLRVSDVEGLFSEASVSAVTVPTRVVGDTYEGTIHPWWRERYDDEALFTQHALVVSRSP